MSSDLPLQHCVILVTVASESEGTTIAFALLTEKLAACINIMPVASIYTWQGKINQDQEWQLFIKTNLSHFDSIASKIKELHSYEVPEIIALPIVSGSTDYLNWINQNLQ